MTNKAAPNKVLEFVTCNCKKGKCETNKCPCYSLDMKCTDLCNCKSCSNITTDENIETIEEDDGYENFDDDDEWDEMIDDEDLSDNDNI